VPKLCQLVCQLTVSRNLGNVGISTHTPEPRLKPNVTVRVWTDVIIEFLGSWGLDFRAVTVFQSSTGSVRAKVPQALTAGALSLLKI
jgi:hypothetical protein